MFADFLETGHTAMIGYYSMIGKKIQLWWKIFVEIYKFVGHRVESLLLFPTFWGLSYFFLL